MKNKYRIIFTILAVFLFLGFAESTFAQTATDTLGVANIDDSQLALAGTDIRVIVVKIINTILGLLGIIAVSLIVYAGFIIMTSGGDESKVANGRKIIINAVIGLVIIFSAWAIVKFVFNKLTGEGSYNTGSENTPFNQVLNDFMGSGSLGKIVKDHYPFRDQTNVARNTSVVVTFAVPVDPSSLILNTNNTCWNNDFSGPTSNCVNENGNIKNPYYGDCYLDGTNMKCDTINTSSVKIDLSSNISNSNSGISAYGLANYDNEKNVFTFVFRPIENLGNSTENIKYTVQLLEAIKKSGSNESVFSGLSTKKYIWNFETGTFLDLNPPYVKSVYPEIGKTAVKNSIIQINFNEAVDPTSVQGILKPLGEFDNVLVNTDNKLVPGTFKISNSYQTLEFLPEEKCGTNSCGDTRYCLPMNCAENDELCSKNFEVLLRTATHSGNNDAPFEAIPFSGIYDLALNGLDNLADNPNEGFDKLTKPVVINTNGDNKIIVSSEKNPDNYFWNFNIINKIDNEAPYIVSVLPNIEREDVLGESSVDILFNKLLRLDTLKDISIEEYPKNVCLDSATTSTPCSSSSLRLDDLWFKTSASNIDNKTKLSINHREFGPNGLDLYYFPSVPHSVQDINQNCFYPGFGPMNQNEDCRITYLNGEIVNKQNCTNVNFDSSQDTSCVYNTVSSTSNIESCLNILRSESLSTYKNQ